MRITDELFLPEIENVKPGILSSHPQHAPPILIDRENGVTIEAIRVAFIVLKPVREIALFAGQSNRDPGWMAPIIHSAGQPEGYY